MNNHFDTRRAIILVGMFWIILGFFLPITTWEGISSYYGSDRVGSSYTYLLITMSVASILIILKKDEMLWIIGLLILGMLSNDLRLVADQADEFGLSLAWGWIPLFGGSLLLIFTVFLGEDFEGLPLSIGG